MEAVYRGWQMLGSVWLVFVANLEAGSDPQGLTLDTRRPRAEGQTPRV